MARDLGKRPKAWRRLEVVASRRLGEGDDPRAAVSRAAGGIERDVPITRPRGEEKQVNASGVGDLRVIRRWIVRVRKPDRRHLGRDVSPNEGVAGPRRRLGRVTA